MSPIHGSVWIMDAEGDVMSDCPFTVGQLVIFKPHARTFGQQVMVENLTPGSSYRISEIRDQAFIRLVDHETAGRGLHWSAFTNA